jgi:hypothetical protein
MTLHGSLALACALQICSGCSHGRPALSSNTSRAEHALPPQEKLAPAVMVKRDCDQEHIDCFRDCMRRPPPEFKKDKGALYRVCQSQCLKAYMDCVKAQESELREFSTMDTAFTWLNQHKKEIAVGAIVIVAGTAFVVVTGGAGALALAPLAI